MIIVQHDDYFLIGGYKPMKNMRSRQPTNHVLLGKLNHVSVTTQQFLMFTDERSPEIQLSIHTCSPNLGARERLGNAWEPAWPPSFKASCNAASIRRTALPSPLNESFSLTMTCWEPWRGMWIKWSWKMNSWRNTDGEFLVDKCLYN